jgi:hypothetical protein
MLAPRQSCAVRHGVNMVSHASEQEGNECDVRDGVNMVSHASELHDNRVLYAIE